MATYLPSFPYSATTSLPLLAVGLPSQELGIEVVFAYAGNPVAGAQAGRTAIPTPTAQIALSRVGQPLLTEVGKYQVVVPRDHDPAWSDLTLLCRMIPRDGYPITPDMGDIEAPVLRVLYSVGMGVANTGSSSGGGGTGGSARPVSGQMWPRGKG